MALIMPSTLLLPPPQTMLKLLLFSGMAGTTPPTVPGDTVTPGTVPGEPNRKLPEPLPKIEVLASLSLVRLTSTKRISVCTWLGNSGSSDGGAAASVINAVALPRTNTMLCRGEVEHAVQTIRLVAPGPTPVSRKPSLPPGVTSATFGSPTANRVMATEERTSCCIPCPTSNTGGNAASPEHPALAAIAESTRKPAITKAHATPFKTSTERLLMSCNPCSGSGSLLRCLLRILVAADHLDRAWPPRNGCARTLRPGRRTHAQFAEVSEFAFGGIELDGDIVITAAAVAGPITLKVFLVGAAHRKAQGAGLRGQHQATQQRLGHRQHRLARRGLALFLLESLVIADVARSVSVQRRAELFANAQYTHSGNNDLRGAVGVAHVLGQKQQHVYIITRAQLPPGTDHFIYTYGQGAFTGTNHPRQGAARLKVAFTEPGARRQWPPCTAAHRLLGFAEAASRYDFQALDHKVIGFQRYKGRNVPGQYQYRSASGVFNGRCWWCNNHRLWR